jgi:sugar (pentulose or hexulose) kinase
MTSTSSPELRSISDHRDESFFIGIDVGTGSARAGVFSEAGKMLATASRKTAMWRPQAKFVEQSSENIWQSCVEAVRAAVSESGIDPARVRGIGFDATCSLVALDASGRPVSVSPTGRDEQNIIVWMDHRAVEGLSHLDTFRLRRRNEEPRIPARTRGCDRLHRGAAARAGSGAARFSHPRCGCSECVPVNS